MTILHIFLVQLWHLRRLRDLELDDGLKKKMVLRAESKPCFLVKGKFTI